MTAPDDADREATVLYEEHWDTLRAGPTIAAIAAALRAAEVREREKWVAAAKESNVWQAALAEAKAQMAADDDADWEPWACPQAGCGARIMTWWNFCPACGIDVRDRRHGGDKSIRARGGKR